jgi:hypothetical protein
MARRVMPRHPLQYPRDTVFFDREKFQKPPTKQDFATQGCGWVTVYPVYLDKNKTKVQGRRVTLDIACQVVSASHIFEACKRLKLGRVLEVLLFFCTTSRTTIDSNFHTSPNSLARNILEIGEDGVEYVFRSRHPRERIVILISKQERICLLKYVRWCRRSRCRKGITTIRRRRRRRKRRRRRRGNLVL